MKKSFVFVLLCSVFLTACSNNQESNSTNNVNTTETSEIIDTSKDAIQSSEHKKQDSSDFSNDDVDIKINGISLGKSTDNADIVFIDYYVKNKTDVSIKAQDLFMNYIKAYQNGNEFEVGQAFVDSTNPKYEDVNKLSQEVYPNEEINASFIYALYDTSSPITLNFHNRNSDDILKTKNYETQ